MATLFEAALEVERLAAVMRDLGPRATPVDRREYRRAIERFDRLCSERNGFETSKNTMSPIEAARMRKMLTAIRLIETVEAIDGRL